MDPVHQYTSSNNRKLEVVYKQIFRNFLQSKGEGTTNEMVHLNIDPYDVIVQKLLFLFSQRVKFSDNTALQTIVITVYFTFSAIYKRRCNLLY